MFEIIQSSTKITGEKRIAEFSISIWSAEKNKSITMDVQLTNPKYFWIWTCWYSSDNFQILPLSLRRFVGNSSWQGTPVDYMGQSMAEWDISDDLWLWKGHLLTGNILISTEFPIPQIFLDLRTQVHAWAMGWSDRPHKVRSWTSVGSTYLH